jgi:FAD/FMN-containing dehydrogenase
VSSWGRLSADAHQVQVLADRARVAAQIGGSGGDAPLPGLAHGAGRSYGDVALNPGGVLWLTTALDRFIAFDAQRGRLQCEAGVLLADIQRLLLPRGWTLPVLPGTQCITVGGAIANDVHGKNHHRRGSFGDHVLALELQRTDGHAIACGPQQAAPWFQATVGGLGLTGVITRADLQLLPCPGPWLDTETLAFEGLDEFFALADASEADWEHTVAWIDCLRRGATRGLFLRSRPAADQQGLPPPPRRRALPLVPPLSLVNGASLRAFNALYFRRGRRRAGPAREAAESHLFPLDAIAHWNRIYGPCGFYQYQSLVPREQGPAATQAMLEAIAASGEGSFLAVLKTFGQRRSAGLLGFAGPGVTLALDFPNRGARTLALFGELDRIVQQAHGRLYLAKDARMPRVLFEAGYPQAPALAAYRDPGISSALSRRLLGH